MRTITIMVFSLMLVLSACSGTSDTNQTSSDGQNNTPASSNENNADNGEKAEENDADDGDNNSAENEEGDNETKNNESQDNEEATENTFEQKEPEYEMNENYYIEPIDDADPKVVLLTIDDAPEDHAVEMAKKLKEMDAPAIFYINKIYVDDGGKEDLKKLHDMGFPLGNHTATHPNLSDLSQEEQEDELEPVYDQIEDITGDPVKFFRAPHGVNTDVSNEIADEHDALVMNWSYGYDFKADYEDADKLTDIMLDPDPSGLLRDGAILLMHDRDWTNEALEDIVEGLRDKGYKILDPALLKTPQSPDRD